MKKRNYSAERNAASKWADHVMNAEDLEFDVWTHNWGLVFDAYLAGLRGKSVPDGEKKHG